ncbi:MAG: hypothetical protein QXF45_03150 [Candidatus Caldarchaeum sp.]
MSSREKLQSLKSFVKESLQHVEKSVQILTDPRLQKLMENIDAVNPESIRSWRL